MIAASSRVSDYFSPPYESVWRWSRDGTVIETRDGKTICFRHEAEQVLLHLAPRGLPPFGAIVLLLAACRESWRVNNEFRGALAGFANFVDEGPAPSGIASQVKGLVKKEVIAVLGELERINALNLNMRKDIPAKLFLAESVFETAEKSVTGQEALDLVKAFRDGIPAELLAPTNADGATAFLRAIEALRPLRRITNEDLELRRKTGLDQEVVPAEAEIPPPQRVRNLIAALQNDPDSDLSGMARLAQNLMAAVHVPRKLTPSEELPLGGYTDISNRGPLDRLLPSELAHDDLTLAVRVALNEALYLRRESPPRSPPEQRAILIDAGIRMWGLPRLFGAAVALALASTGDPRSQLLVCRARKSDVDSVDLTTRNGIVVHMGALESAPHPGTALKPFFDAVRATVATAETILITHPDVLADTDFRAELAATLTPELYVATVDRDGTFRFLYVTASGQTLLREAKLDLEAILAPRPRAVPAVPLKDKAIDPFLPAILSMAQFPLRVPHSIDPRRAKYSKKDSLVTVTADGRLMHWNESKRGPLQISTAVPRGYFLKLFITEDSQALVLFYQQATRDIVLFRVGLADGQTDTRTLKTCGKVPLHLRYSGSRLFLIYENSIEIHNIDSGERTMKQELPPTTRWVNGRFFEASYKWFALDDAGSLVQVKTPKFPSDFVALIDREGLDGPWGLTPSGSLISCVNSEELKGTPLKVRCLVDVSEDGNRLVVKTRTHPALNISLEIKSQVNLSRVDKPAAQLAAWLEPGILRNTLSLRSAISRIGIAQDGSIIIVNKSGEFFIHLDKNNKLNIVKGTKPHFINPITFKPVSTPPGMRFNLSAATFADGSRIFLDSRGMLHLQNSDKKIPEITLVLYDPHVAGWCTDGEQCGDDYFIRSGTTIDDRTFFSKIRAFTLRLR